MVKTSKVLSSKWKGILIELGGPAEGYLPPPFSPAFRKVERALPIAKEYLRSIITEVKDNAYDSARQLCHQYEAAISFLEEHEIEHSLPSLKEVEKLCSKK